MTTVTHASQKMQWIYIYKYSVKATLFDVKRSRAYRCNISCSLQRNNFLYKRRNVNAVGDVEQNIFTQTLSRYAPAAFTVSMTCLCNRIPHPCEYLLTCTYNAHSICVQYNCYIYVEYDWNYILRSHLQNVLFNSVIRREKMEMLRSFALTHFDLKIFILFTRYTRCIRDWMN